MLSNHLMLPVRCASRLMPNEETPRLQSSNTAGYICMQHISTFSDATRFLFLCLLFLSIAFY